MSFDFGAAVGTDVAAYAPSMHEVLPKGNYVCTVAFIENATSSGGFPMLKITVENEQGRQWDNLVISPNEFSVQKLLGLIDAADVPRPDPEQGEIDAKDGRLTDAYVQRLEGKQVGVVVRDEEDNRPEHAGEVRPRVKGYVAASLVAAATRTEDNGKTESSSGLAF